MKRVGVIAEEDNDVDVVRELIQKIAFGREFCTRQFVGHGFGKIRGRCRHWAENLREQGCSTLILLHDLDVRELGELYNELTQALHPCPIAKNVIVIPVREIEAWLLSDNQAIRNAMHLKAEVPIVSNPESISDPKKYLGNLVHRLSGKTKYYDHTIHNERIASELRVKEVRRCKSFLPLENFVVQNIR